MKMTKSILIAGFGGQGILFAGKILAKMGMNSGCCVSWLPSYGPEMRGGVCNCSVIVSDRDIGSPLVTRPDALIVLNLPSFEKFEPAVRPGGLLIADSSLIDKKSNRDDITASYIPASKIASDEGLDKLANVIAVGHFLALSNLFDFNDFLNDLISGIPPSRATLIEGNKKALTLGYEW